MTLALICASRFGASLVKALATLGTYALTSVRRHMTLALICASRFSASLVKALATVGAYVLAFVSRRCYLVTLALLSTSRFSARAICALATLGAYVLAFVSRRCYLVTFALLCANRLGTSLIKALAAHGAFALTLMRGKLVPTCIEGHIALYYIRAKFPLKGERIVSIPSGKFITFTNRSIGFGYKLANVNSYVGNFISAARIKAYGCRYLFAAKNIT